jgi:hypothetical protein
MTGITNYYDLDLIEKCNAVEESTPEPDNDENERNRKDGDDGADMQRMGKAQLFHVSPSPIDTSLVEQESLDS